MALSKARLKTDIKAKLITLYTSMKVAPISDSGYADALADIISDTIIAEITGNAVVPSGIELTTPDTINGTTTGAGTVA